MRFLRTALDLSPNVAVHPAGKTSLCIETAPAPSNCTQALTTIVDVDVSK